MDELDVIHYISYMLVAVAVIVSFIQVVFNFEIPYGRYSRAGFGFGVPARLAWFAQELPALVIPAYMYYFGVGAHLGGAFNTNSFLLLLFMLHYFQRTFVYSLLIKTHKPTPLLSFLSAVAFCCLNGYIQGRTLAEHATFEGHHWTSSPRVLVGALVFLVGMAVNIHSDRILRNLRKGNEKEYKIPRGGLFTFVSGANYLGEAVEWSGFALASGSVPAVCFAVFTTLVLGSRSTQYHRFYLQKFEDYPKCRKAFVPFLL